MGSRKENLKKSLGISEYPWSSDEEENNTTQPSPVLRRQSDETRPSVPDMPSTSSGNAGSTSTLGGAQQSQATSPATVRRQQAKMDRALFWSIINNTPRPNNVGVTRSRICDMPLTYVTRSAIPARPEMREPRRHERTGTADIQRLLAFKKLTRNLHNLTQCRQSSNMQPTTSRRGAGSGGSSRSSLFTPSLSAASNARPRTYNNCCNRSHPGRCSLPPGFTRNGNPPDVLPVPEPQPSSSSRYRPLPRAAPAPEIDTSPPAPDPHQYVNVDQSDEDKLPEPQPSSSSRYRPVPHAAPAPDIDTSPPTPDPHRYVNVDQSDEDVEAVPHAPPAAEQTDDNNADNEDENNETPTHDASAGAISLEEEVMEVDAPDEPDTAPAAEVETDATEPTAVNESNAVATNSDENAETSQQQSPFHGIKRKRETTDETAEPYSVQEFNQSLLRLLECPVCLEWMEPPISQCRRGHLVCSRCRTRLASCPVCRTTFSSVRNRAMEGFLCSQVAEMLRYPCRHGCGREVRLRRRAPHEASCGARRYHCPAPPCARHPPLAHHELAHHFQCKHLPIVKIGRKHKFSMKVNSEQHDTWLIMALDEYFHLRVDVDIRTWGVIVYVAYIGPKRKAKHYTYEVTVEGQHNSRSLKYARATHSDLESSSLNVSRQDCFHLTLDQALNFLRFKNRHCEPDKFLDFDVEIGKCQSSSGQESKDDSDS